MNRYLPLALLLMRLSIFLVMLMWTLDKFINVEHALRVYEHFYLLGFVGPGAMLALAVIELLVIFAFVAGAFKSVSYLLVLIWHAVSTLTPLMMYLTPFETGHLLFFAAWPMLAACLALYLLRDDDRLWSLNL